MNSNNNENQKFTNFMRMLTNYSKNLFCVNYLMQCEQRIYLIDELKCFLNNFSIDKKLIKTTWLLQKIKQT